MKTLTTLTAAAVLIAGMSIAGAQTTSPSTSPGMGGSAASGSKMKVTGTGKFCVEQSPGGALDCKFASMAACEKDAKTKNSTCKPNPNTGGTTGAR